MFDEGKWKIELKRNGRYVKLEFNNLILDDAIFFNFDYSVNNSTDAIITHMFLSAVNGDVKSSQTTMAGVPFADIPYVDYIKPNFDNPAATVYENTLVFKYIPTETATIKQIGTGRVLTGGGRRFFSIANVLNELGERAELVVKPGDELTFTYTITQIARFLEFDQNYPYAKETKANFNNLMKANPNWTLSGYKRQLEVMAPLVSDHLGVAVKPSFNFVIDYGTVSANTGQRTYAPMYNVTWTTVDGSSMSTIDANKFKTTFKAAIFPWSLTTTQSVSAPTGSSWSYTQQFYITNGMVTVDRFDHTKTAPMLPPKEPEAFSHQLLEADYVWGTDANKYAKWSIDIRGAEPLAQIFVIQNNEIINSTGGGLRFVGKDGTFKGDYKINILKRNQPFFVYFYNRVGQFKYGPLFVNSTDYTLKGVIEQPLYFEGDNPVTDFYYPQSSYYSNRNFYIRPYGRITNDVDGKTIFYHVVADKATADNPEAYTELSNRYSENVAGLYSIPTPDNTEVGTWLAKPNAVIRIKLTRDALEYYEIPLTLKMVSAAVSKYIMNKDTFDAMTAKFSFKKMI